MMASAFLATAKSGYMLRSNNGSLKKQTERGMEWAVQIPFGAKVEILSETPVKAIYYWTGGKSKNAMEFYKVQYQSKEYFITANECAIGDSPIVLTEDATLFTKSRISTFRNAFLLRGTICLATGRRETAGSVSFSEVIFYDTDEATLKTRWVQTKKISDDQNDVKAAQLVELAFVQADKGMKENFMKLALKIESTAKIREYVEEMNRKMFNIIDGKNAADIPQQEALVSTDDGATVNLRAAPQNGDVLAKLANGSAVTLLKMTAETDKIEGLTEHWYFVQAKNGDETVEGWIFGGYISFLKEAEETSAE